MSSRSRSFIFYGFVLSLLIYLHGCFGQEWDYGALGPDVWPDIYPRCGGSEQSPINIQTKKTKYKKYSPLKLSQGYSQTQQFRIQRKDFTVVATLANASVSLLTISGAGLQGTFGFTSFLLRWGQNYASGSEHRVDGTKYAGELQFIHKNLITKKVAIFSFLIQSVQGNETGDESFTALFRPYLLVGSVAALTNRTFGVQLNLGEALQSYSQKFWRYQGSLTNPICSEGVTWTVFASPIQINDSELTRFRRAFPLNFREPQPLNGRKVYRNFDPSDSRYSY